MANINNNSNRLQDSFSRCSAAGRACFVGFLTAGYPTVEESADLLLSMQSGGVDIIEMGVPFSDPIADGPIIQYASQIALANSTTMNTCFDILDKARSKGLTVPVVFMGYLNPFMMYGKDKWISKCKESGVDGVIIVDFPPDEAVDWISSCRENGISFVPLIAPTTADERIAGLCSAGDGFIYVVSSLGVTGQRSSVNTLLPDFLNRIRKYTNLPLAVGFGISTADQFQQVASLADGVVIGSRFIQTIRDCAGGATDKCESVKKFASTVSAGNQKPVAQKQHDSTIHSLQPTHIDEHSKYKFGDFGGRFVSESLIFALSELESCFNQVINDESFWKEFKSFYPFINRPSPLQLAQNLTQHCNGARLWLKREDLNHTGSHKINNALGQVLLAKRLGKTRIIAETGAGQHGVATATVCAHFKIPCRIYMGKTDTERQALNVFRMRLLGAEVFPVSRGGKAGGEGTLKDAINEAMRDWVTNVESTHYLVGSAIGPHPFPSIVKEFQSVIGNEAKSQFRQLVKEKNNPDVLIACVGGGSNAIGLFGPFLNEKTSDGSPVELVGVEAGGEGVETGKHSAPLSAGTPGVLHGCKTYLMQDKDGQIAETHSISAGLDYPGVGPEHAHLKDSNRAQYVAVSDKQALMGLKMLSKLEGIIPALETSHAIYHAMELAKQLDASKDIIISLSGRGDKDVEQVQKLLSMPQYQ